MVNAKILRVINRLYEEYYEEVENIGNDMIEDTTFENGKLIAIEELAQGLGLRYSFATEKFELN